MESARKLDAEINHYLTRLTDRQKEAVLKVVKTFAEESTTVPYNSELKKLLDQRYHEYRNGGALLSEADVNEQIKAIINGNEEK